MHETVKKYHKNMITHGAVFILPLEPVGLLPVDMIYGQGYNRRI